MPLVGDMYKQERVGHKGKASCNLSHEVGVHERWLAGRSPDTTVTLLSLLGNTHP